MDAINMSQPVLYRYEDAVPLRVATAEEMTASRQAAQRDAGAGVISVDGVGCYVME